MQDVKVLTIDNKRNFLIDRRCVKHKGDYDRRMNGGFRARLVACGCCQIPGVDVNKIKSRYI
jgi:hypothetical protein